MGVPEEHIITQACPELASYIEKDPKGEDTALLIESYVDEALAKFKKGFGFLLASLNCTHFGYSMNLWQKAFAGRRVPSFMIIDPNALLAMKLISREKVKRYEATTISVQVVSMVEIGREKIEALGGWLKKISPETAEALARYELKKDLFEWKKFVKR
jgi:glutamate racemase